MAGTHGFGARGVFDDGGPAGDANTERSSAFGSLRADMLAHVGQIRRLQLQMFKEHIELESQPGPDVAFGVPDDSADAFAPGGESAGRFKPLGDWFEAKEKGIQRLTEKLEHVCSEMKSLNSDAAQHISGMKVNSDGTRSGGDGERAGASARR